jgi:hypothetical protein
MAAGRVVISHRLPGTIWKSGSLSEDRIAGKTGHRIALVDGKLVLALDRDINSRPCRVEGRKIFQPAFPAEHCGAHSKRAQRDQSQAVLI